jgi:leader peptidase (prepilin peptidase)/N-methyltransferase
MNWESILFAVPMAVAGASVGSFLNVVIYRLPRQLSVVRPGSHCPKCKTPLGPRENLPLVGWLALRGRCRHCGTSISWRYPAVEATTMAFFLLCFVAWGFSCQAWAAAAFLSWLLALALIDFDTYLLPEELTRSGLVAGAIARVLLPILSGHGTPQAIAASLIVGVMGAVLGILGLEAIGLLGRLLLKKEAMGLGDGKLLAAIGMGLGWQAVLVTLFLGCLSGVVGAGIGMALQKTQLGRPIPFGPYLALGGAIALFVGPQLIDAYLSLMGLSY